MPSEVPYWTLSLVFKSPTRHAECSSNSDMTMGYITWTKMVSCVLNEVQWLAVPVHLLFLKVGVARALKEGDNVDELEVCGFQDVVQMTCLLFLLSVSIHKIKRTLLLFSLLKVSRPRPIFRQTSGKPSLSSNKCILKWHVLMFARDCLVFSAQEGWTVCLYIA